MPTYFQLGRNTVDAGEKIFTHDRSVNKGLVNITEAGGGPKRFNIPIQANILAKSDSRERLNLAPHMHHETEMTP